MNLKPIKRQIDCGNRPARRFNGVLRKSLSNSITDLAWAKLVRYFGWWRS
jgi:hypothetical protein